MLSLNAEWLAVEVELKDLKSHSTDETVFKTSMLETLPFLSQKKKTYQ